MPNFNAITLFYPVAKKYENLIEKSLVRHINLCLTPIKNIFLILDSNINSISLMDKLAKNIKDIELSFITDNQAIEILNFKGIEHQKIIRDKHYFQQMLKLHIDILSNEEKIVIADTDGLILTPVKYIEDNKDVIYYSENSIGNYNFANEFFKFPAATKYDFLTEKIVFNSKILKDFRTRYYNNFFQYSESRHKWYDITAEEYNFFKGANYPSNFTGWNNLPLWVQNEIKTFLPDEIIPTQYSHVFSEYQLYGTFAYHFYQNEIILKPTKVQSGPFADQNEDYDVFINRPIEGGTVGAFEYVYQKYNK